MMMMMPMMIGIRAEHDALEPWCEPCRDCRCRGVASDDGQSCILAPVPGLVHVVVAVVVVAVGVVVVVVVVLDPTGLVVTGVTCCGSANAMWVYACMVVPGR
jgi:hypothetical protein